MDDGREDTRMSKAGFLLLIMHMSCHHCHARAGLQDLHGQSPTNQVMSAACLPSEQRRLTTLRDDYHEA
jgi:hypothetical protein